MYTINRIVLDIYPKDRFDAIIEYLNKVEKFHGNVYCTNSSTIEILNLNYTATFDEAVQDIEYVSCEYNPSSMIADIICEDGTILHFEYYEGDQESFSMWDIIK